MLWQENRHYMRWRDQPALTHWMVMLCLSPFEAISMVTAFGGDESW
jgi:hypothetical protein